MSGRNKVPVLVFDSDPWVIEDFRMILDPPPRNGDGLRSNGSDFEAEIYGSISARRDFPEVGLTVETESGAAVEAARRAIERGQPFDVAFVDIGTPPGNWGLDVAETIRALDPELPIALLVAQGDLNPVDLCKRIPPCDRLNLLFKPIQAPTIQQLVLAADARRASDRAHALMRAKPRAVATELLSECAIGLIVADRDKRIATATKAVFSLFPELAGELGPGAKLPDDLGSLIGQTAINTGR